MKKPKVYHIFTGSAASLMSKEVLGGESCLFGRIFHKDLFPLSPPGVNQLIDFHTDGPVPEWSNEARTALYEITEDHPFYAKCLVKNLLEARGGTKKKTCLYIFFGLLLLHHETQETCHRYISGSPRHPKT